MRLAYIKSQKRGETDRLLCELAEALQAEGVALSGVVKDQDHASRHANGYDMKIRVLPQGPVIKITQDLGDGSDACRLDAAALTRAVSEVEAGPMAGTDLFILNKFGPEERAGRGFCAALAAALERGIPVIVGLGAASEPDFLRFTGGLAQALPDDMVQLKAWCCGAMLVANHADRRGTATLR
tara:strand:+ start:155 stop:703 length:549 start_codon:yes stop_codon:yes gene_type:complete